MESEASIHTPLKKRPSDELLTTPKKNKVNNKCFICNRRYPLETVSILGIDGQKTLLRLSHDKNDTSLYSYLNQSNINHLMSLGEIGYHRSCYREYTKESVSAKAQNEDKMTEKRSTRSEDTVHNNDVCILCEKISYKKDRVLHEVKDQNTILSMKRFAKDTENFNVIGRIESFHNMYQNVKYHTGCYSKLQNQARRNKSVTPKSQSNASDDIVGRFIVMIDDNIKQGKIYTLVELTHIYQSLLPANSSAINPTRVQNILKSHYGDAITIHNQHGQGKSNIICSSKISIGSILGNIDPERENILPSISQEKVRSPLHRVAERIRNDIRTQTAYINDMYPKPDGVSLDASERLVPESLQSFLYEVIDSNATSESTYTPSTKIKRRCLAIGECIMYAASGKVPPLHLGLALQMQHDYGKRCIIDTLNSHGFCASYDEIRRFNTSAAVEQQDKTMENGVFIPPSLISRQEGGRLIHEAADNLDINTATFDGKDTLHCLAGNLFQLQSNQQVSNRADQNIVRQKKRSLPVTSGMDLKYVDHYEKPILRPVPQIIPDALMKVKRLLQFKETRQVMFTNLIWVLLRQTSRSQSALSNLIDDHAQQVPFWTGYKSVCSSPRETSITKISYDTIIDRKATDPATLYTRMKRSLKRMEILGQEHAIITFDQQLYAIAQNVVWSAPDLKDVVLRMGGFHMVESYIAAIGKIWGSAGLRELLVDSKVFAANTADHILNGNQYNRAARALMLSYEVLRALQLEAFLSSQDNSDVDSLFKDILDKFNGHNNQIKDNMQELALRLQEGMQNKLSAFIATRSLQSKTFKFWSEYLDAIEALLLFIEAERAGNWNLHLHATVAMLPHYFAAGRTNYARWLPVYIMDMINLPDKVKTPFEDGDFTVHMTPASFNGVWSDMATEMNVIRDAKGGGGIVGISNNEQAILRWTLTRQILGQYSKTFKERSGLSANNYDGHEQESKSFLERDETHASMMMKHIQDYMIDPFSVRSPSNLVHISSGKVANMDVDRSLCNIIEYGQKESERFVSRVFEQGKEFYAPIKSTIVTFQTQEKASKVKVKGKVKNVIISPELVFRRTLVLSEAGKISMEEVMNHPISSIPPSLFHEDGSFRKTNKAVIIHKIEAQCPSEKLIPIPSHAGQTHDIIIRDSMSELHKSKYERCEKFEDIIRVYVAGLTALLQDANVVVEVFDRYDQPSVKDGERVRRGEMLESETLPYTIELKGNIPGSLEQFLRKSSNKIALIHFLCDYMTSHQDIVPSGKSLRIACNGSTVEIHSHKVCREVLKCTHMEADTQIIAQMINLDKHLEQSNKQVRFILHTQDTDVFVLALHHFVNFRNTKEVWIYLGVVTKITDKRRFFPVHKAVDTLGAGVCNILPMLHALTGCDTTSSFFGIGKSKAIDKMMKNPNEFQGLSSLALPYKKKAIKESTKVVKYLYGVNSNESNLNKIRASIVRTNPSVSLSKIPPSEQALTEHVLRAMYQSKVWIDANNPEPVAVDPTKYGWVLDNSILQPVYFCGKSATEVVDNLICDCKDKCNNTCSCKEQSMCCSTICRCACDGCNNV